ncbi:hypothetical protein ACE6ED_13195 [Paenibacillus sp. CN-4]|uniref:hypothetical protein n=1 Tax=Paenibacillus nanchangensis TaxID=3348343 RepID=UPI00397B2525
MKKAASKETGILSTLQSCHDAGAELSLIKGIIAMYRRFYADQVKLQRFIDDMEVRFISSLEGSQE